MNLLKNFLFNKKNNELYELFNYLKNNSGNKVLQLNIISKKINAQSLKLKKKKTLVLAPHPDDEIIGCYGALRKINNTRNIQILYLTTGISKKSKSYLKDCNIRKKEAINFCKKEKLLNPIFFNNPSKSLKNFSKKETQKINNIIKNFNPEYIFLPFLYDRVEDHFWTNKILLNTTKDIKTDPVILGYQISSFIFLNSYLNITSFIRQKENAMKIYKSVQKKLNYIPLFKGLNLYNSYFVKKNSKREEFYEVYFKTNLKSFVKILLKLF